MKFAEVAKAADVAIDAVRFYEWEGLLPQTARWPAGHRDYSSATILDLQMVKRATALGSPLQEIFELRSLSRTPH